MTFDIAELAVRLPAILLAITVHEFAHARVALAFGDDTAESEGRVTLNPLAHLDPIGTIGLVFGTFGWGRPVPVNPHRFRHPRADFAVSAAGPASNLLLAVAGGLALVLLPTGLDFAGDPRLRWLVTFLIIFVQMNLALCFFNFLPLHPLDGSHMVENLLPVEKAWRFKQFNEAYGMQILFALILAGMFGFPLLWFVLGIPVNLLSSLLIPGRYFFL